MGKYMGSINNIVNRQSLIFAVVSRCIFFVPIIALSNKSDEGDFLLDNYAFPFFNQFLFGVTNGFVTSMPTII